MEFSVLVLIIVVLAVVCVLRCTPARMFPGPPRAWIVGNAHQFSYDSFYEFIKRTADYDSVAEFFVLGKRFVVVSDVEIVKTLLLERPLPHIRKMKQASDTIDAMGVGGLFTAEGDAWRSLRRAFSNGFTNTSLKPLIPGIAKVVANTVEKWKAKEDFEDVKEASLSFSLKMSLLNAFGYDLDAAPSSGSGSSMILQTETFFSTLKNRLINPIPYWKYFWLPADYRHAENIRSLQKIVHDYIKESDNRTNSTATYSVHPSILSGLFTEKNREGLSEKDLIANSLQFLMASYHSTGITISACLYYLCCNPEFQQRIREEYDEVFTKNSKDITKATFDDYNQLKTTKNVISEAMRLSPALGLFMLETTTANYVMKGKHIPKGTTIICLTEKAAMKVFRSPEKFDPDRFDREMTPDEKAFSSYGFGGGPRVCIGKNIALVEMALFVAHVCANLSLKLDPSVEPMKDSLANEKVFKFVVESKHKIPVVVERLPDGRIHT